MRAWMMDFSNRLRSQLSGRPAPRARRTAVKATALELLELRQVLSSAPTALQLSSTSVPENQPVGTVVGTFSSIDGDPGDTFTYSLITSNTPNNNNQFTIEGDKLKTNSVFDFEAGSTYQILARTTDSFGLSKDQAFTINVTDVQTSSVGQVDESFATGGYSQPVGSAAGPTLNAIGEISGGTLFAVGGDSNGAVLVKLQVNGAMDLAWGASGIVHSDFGGTHASVLSDIATDSNQRLVVVGQTSAASNQLVLARYSSDGQLDTNFHSTGFVLEQVGGLSTQARKVAITPDGKILVAGYTTAADSSSTSVFLIRYNSDGTRDTTFGTGGVVSPGVGTSTGDSGLPVPVIDVAVQSTGRPILLAGTMVVAYRNNGTPDADQFGFVGLNGAFIVTTIVPASIAVDKLDRIVVAGQAGAPTGYRLAAIRLQSTGILDADFGTSGLYQSKVFSTQGTSAHSVAIEADGRIIIVGDWIQRSVGFRAGNAIVISLTPTGQADTTFSADEGQIQIAFPGIDIPLGVPASAYDVLIQPTGRIVLVGKSGKGIPTVARVEYNLGPMSAPARMYRAYNPNKDFHFFTTSKGQFDNAVQAGYRDEATGNSSFGLLTSETFFTKGLYRLYNFQTGAHYYTIDKNEKNYLIGLVPPGNPSYGQVGWRDEGIEGYMWDRDLNYGATIVYRLYNQTTGVHLFTENAGTAAGIVSTFPNSWSIQSNLGYALRMPKLLPGSASLVEPDLSGLAAAVSAPLIVSAESATITTRSDLLLPSLIATETSVSGPAAAAGTSTSTASPLPHPEPLSMSPAVSDSDDAVSAQGVDDWFTLLPRSGVDLVLSAD